MSSLSSHPNQLTSPPVHLPHHRPDGQADQDEVWLQVKVTVQMLGTSLPVYAHSRGAVPQPDPTEGIPQAPGHQRDHQDQGRDLHSSGLPTAHGGGLEMLDTEEEVLMKKEVLLTNDSSSFSFQDKFFWKRSLKSRKFSPLFWSVKESCWILSRAPG